MKKHIAFARDHGISANGFWSIGNNDHSMTKEQLDLREMVLKEETFPANLQLLVLNASAETSVKIQGDKRQVDYMIIHTTDEDTQTQVRGRYCGDLDRLYLHGKSKDDVPISVPPQFLNVRLFVDEKNALCEALNLRDANGRLSKWSTVKKRLLGYAVEEGREQNRRFAILTEKPFCQK